MNKKTLKKIYAGPDSNIPVEIIDELIDDKERNWKGYKTIDNQFVEAHRLFDTHKEADEYVFNQQRNKKTQNNNVKSFFNDKIKLKSFDTETTGLNWTNSDFNKRDKIWQLGLAEDGVDGVESHVNPFFIHNENGSIEITEVKPRVMLQDFDVQAKAKYCREYIKEYYKDVEIQYRFITEKDLFNSDKEYQDFLKSIK